MQSVIPGGACPPPRALAASRTGELQGEELEHVTRHLGACATCAQTLFRLEMGENVLQTTGVVDGAPVLARGNDFTGSRVGRYLLLQRLGEGGEGVVYSAYDPQLDRKVAMKLLQLDHRQGGAPLLGTERLVREAKSMAKLAHPNVVAIYDVGQTDEHGAFMAMELVHGRPLREWLKTSPSWREALRVMRAAGEGLASAHRAGLTHGDFKPDNVLLADSGRVQVMDFGLSRLELGTGDAPAQSLPAALGKLEGTPAYLAPEQLALSPATPRSDQFSFAVALYEALYAERPFRGSPLMRPEPARWLVQAAPRGSKVPAFLRRILLRALSPDPAARFASLEEMLAALDEDPRAKLRRAAWAMGALLTLAAVVAAVRFSASRRQELCRGAETKLAGVWDPPRRAAVRSAIFAGPPRLVGPAWEQVQQGLEEYSRRWVKGREEACEATRISGEQSEEVLTLRMACLDRRLLDLRALTDELSHPSPTLWSKAPLAVDALSDLGGCADVLALKAHRPRLRSAEQMKLELEVSQTLATAKALLAAGDTAGSHTTAQKALDVLGTLDEPQLRAEGLLRSGWALAFSYQTAGLEVLANAVVEAYRAGSEELLVQSARERLRLAEVLGQLGDVQPYAKLGDAAAASPQVSDFVRLSWRAVRARVARAQHHATEARSLGLSAAGEARTSPRLSPLERAEILSNASVALHQLGSMEQSKAAVLEALGLRVQVLGPSHPLTVKQRINVSAVLMDAGDAEGSVREALLGHQAVEQTDQMNTVSRCFIDVNLGEGYLALGEMGRAAQTLAATAEACRSSLGAQDSTNVMIQDDLALVDLTEGRETASASSYERNLQQVVGVLRLPADDPERLRALIGEARTRARKGAPQARVAVSAIHNALEALEKSTDPSADADIAQGQLALAQTQALVPELRLASLETARQSAERFHQLGRPFWEQRVRAWMEQRARSR